MESLTHLVDKTELNIQAKEGATLTDLFNELGRECGESVKNKIIAPDGDFHPYILISVNGNDARGINGINTCWNEGDEVLVALLITGG
jgi:hypothetical protein